MRSCWRRMDLGRTNSVLLYKCQTSKSETPNQVFHVRLVQAIECFPLSAQYSPIDSAATHHLLMSHFARPKNGTKRRRPATGGMSAACNHQFQISLSSFPCACAALQSDVAASTAHCRERSNGFWGCPHLPHSIQCRIDHKCVEDPAGGHTRLKT